MIFDVTWSHIPTNKLHRSAEVAALTFRRDPTLIHLVLIHLGKLIYIPITFAVEGWPRKPQNAK